MAAVLAEEVRSEGDSEEAIPAEAAPPAAGNISRSWNIDRKSYLELVKKWTACEPLPS